MIWVFGRKLVSLPQIYARIMVVEIIAKYLESNKRLIIPNLGAFIVKVPQQTILFSNLLKGDDGVLRSLVAQQGMSEIEAAGVVDRFVFEINYRLQNNGECRLGGFGRLSKAANGAVNFEFAPTIEGEDVEGALAAEVEPKMQTVESVASSVNVAADLAESVITAVEDEKVADGGVVEKVVAMSVEPASENVSEPVAEATAKPMTPGVASVEPEDDEQENIEIEVTPRTPQHRPQQRRVIRDEVIYDGQKVSASSKMRPDDYVKGLRYGKGRKIVSGRESAMMRRSNKSDLIMKIAIGAALIAVAALAYGMWNDWRASRFDAEIYGEVPESAESGVRNPDLDYIEKSAE